MMRLKRYLERRNQKRNSKARFKQQYESFKRQIVNSKIQRPPMEDKDLFPCIGEDTGTTGFDHHYIYHTAWAANRIIRSAPGKHIDISSYLYFSTILSSAIPIEFYDYRPANIKLQNYTSGKADLKQLPFPTNTIHSLSCMHTVEHVGLGRYGDALDIDGDITAMNELSRVLAPGGKLYFVVPIGRPRICFNAHRIYSYEQIISCFTGLSLKEFSLIPDNAQETGMIEHASPAEAAQQEYACGCFIFQK